MNPVNGSPRRRGGGSASWRWEAFAANLAATLADLSEDEFLVLCKSGTRLFVQFAAQGEVMRAEAVSNEYLEPPFRLSDELLTKLRSFGWRAPTYIQAGVIEEPAEGSPNYYIDAKQPVSYRKLADLTAKTFREAFGVVETSELNYRAWSTDYDSVRFPQLGIRRRDNLWDDFGALLEEISLRADDTTQPPLPMNVLPC